MAEPIVKLFANSEADFIALMVSVSQLSPVEWTWCKRIDQKKGFFKLTLESWAPISVSLTKKVVSLNMSFTTLVWRRLVDSYKNLTSHSIYTLNPF